MQTANTSTNRPRLQNLTIRHFAEELLTDSGAMPISPNETVQLDKVLDYLEFSYFEFDHTIESSSGVDMSNIKGAVIHGDKKIFLNSTLSPQERNFALAHEIGHIKLHRNSDKIDFLKHQLPEIPAEEVEANIFAYDLLMPNHLFHRNVKHFSGNIKELAKFYCLTEKRIQKRIKFEKTISDSLNRKLREMNTSEG